MHKIFSYIALILLTIKTLSAQNYNVEGTVKNLSDSLPVPFATVVLGDNLLWCVTDENGYFILKNIPRDNIKITVQCLGFVTREFYVRRNMKSLKIYLHEDNLTIEEVTV
ncbi:MAG: carboxypeptidase-like regulatory domain-containing protein, partial [Bacteroidales bacterium]|nr:carboxypeptidase-like regulatory domain-containing protein [Bacteroidales bacterium]